MTQAALAQRFSIPLRTVENWDTGQRTPPPYVANMMKELLRITPKAPIAAQYQKKTTIKELFLVYDLSQTELAKHFDIPLRTVEDWHAGRRNPPPYVVNMLNELLLLTRKQKSSPP